MTIFSTIVYSVDLFSQSERESEAERKALQIFLKIA